MTSENNDFETVVFDSAPSAPRKESSIKMPEKLLVVGDILCNTYILRARLGHGGMGEIWRADEVYEGNILRPVVLKTLSPNVQNLQEEFSRIQSMFHKIHSLQHQHICPMYAMKNDPKAGTVIVMKFIDGITLQDYYAQYMRLHGEFPVQEAVRLLRPIAQALDYSHSKKVLHRDVKPQNIMVSKDPSDGVQLIDFGLVMEIRSSLTSQTSTYFDGSGTLPYMSPEQWSGDFQDAKADQFSLAVVVYELLAGRLPFIGANMQVLGFQILNKSPESIPNAPDFVNLALQKALAKNRKLRFETCEEFIDALEKPSVELKLPEDQEPSENNQSPPNNVFTKKYGLKLLSATGISTVLILGIILGAHFNGKQTNQTPETSEPTIPVSEKIHGGSASMLPRGLSAPKIESSQTALPFSETNGALKNDVPQITPSTALNQAENETGDSQKPQSEEELKTDQTTSLNDETFSSDVQSADEKENRSLQGKKRLGEQPKEIPTPEINSVPLTSSTSDDLSSLSRRELLDKAEGAINSAQWDVAFNAFSRVDLKSMTEDELERYAQVCRATENEVKLADIRKVQLENCASLEFIQIFFQKTDSLDEYSLTVQFCDKLLETDPENIQLQRIRLHAFTQEAALKHSTERIRQSLELCDKLLETAPNDASLLAEHGFIYLRNPDVFSKAFDLAKADFEKALKLDPENENALLYQGLLYRDVYSQYEHAVAIFNKILKLNPENRQACLQKGIAYARNMPDEALNCLTQYINETPDCQTAYEYRGKIYYENKNFEDAILDFSKVLLKNTKNIEIRQLRGLAEIQLSRWKDARKDFEYLLKNDRNIANHIDYYLSLAKIYEGAQRRKSAQDMRDKAAELQKTHGRF